MMSQQEQYEEEDFRQSGGGWWIKWVGIIVYIAIIIAYAFQTLELVGWLFPSDTWFMRSVTVFVCDGCATGYAMAEMFYRFRLRKSKTLVFGMWIITFALSTVATVIQMYLSSTHNVPHTIDPIVISVAYGLIIVAFVVNIVAITVIIRMEYGASHPAHRYLDDRPRRKPSPTPAMSQSLLQNDNSYVNKPRERLYDADEVKAMITESVDRVAAYYVRELEEKRQRDDAAWTDEVKRAHDVGKAQSPLQQSPMDTEGSQPGSNGKSH